MSDVDLGEFEGRTVTKTTIAVRRAGDGLSKAMKTEPRLLHQGEKVFVVLECEVGPIKFDPYDDGVCARVQDLIAGVATFLDGELVTEAVEVQREKNRLAEEAERGVQRLPLDDADYLEIYEAHQRGEHDVEPDPHCPSCADREDEEA